MKLVTYSPKDKSAPPAPGLLLETNDDSAPEVLSLAPLNYPTLLTLIESGPKALAAAQTLIPTAARLPLAEVTLHAPIPTPPRIFAIGLNYADHAAESKMVTQQVPTVFLKLSSSVIGPEEPIILPRLSTQPDYEAELAVVISIPGYQLPEAAAMNHVLGYTILNDISARDIQLSTSQWTLGKSFPTFTPLGPAITTADEVPDPHALDITLTINGETLQSANTRDLIFRVPALIAYISSITPLQAGDIISTGTPKGVGMARTPPRWIQPDEEIVITITHLGELRNPTRAGS